MGCYFLRQGIFPTQGSNLGLVFLPPVPPGKSFNFNYIATDKKQPLTPGLEKRGMVVFGAENFSSNGEHFLISYTELSLDMM